MININKQKTILNNPYLVFLVAIGVLVLVVGFVLIAKTFAHSDGKWSNWKDTSSCVAISCGSSEGLKSQERTCQFHEDSNECGSYVPKYKYDDPNCLNGYKYDSSKSWDHSCTKPQHNSQSAFCSQGYLHVVENNVDKCRKNDGFTWVASDKQTKDDVSCDNAPVVACPSTPSATPTQPPPEPTPVPHQDSWTPAGVEPLPICPVIRNRPTILVAKYLGNQTMHLEWTMVEDYVHDYWIDYGPAKNMMLWSTIVHGQETDIHFLQPGNNWFRIAGYDGCKGEFSEVVDPVVR